MGHLMFRIYRRHSDDSYRWAIHIRNVLAEQSATHSYHLSRRTDFMRCTESPARCVHMTASRTSLSARAFMRTTPAPPWMSRLSAVTRWIASQAKFCKKIALIRVLTGPSLSFGRDAEHERAERLRQRAHFGELQLHRLIVVEVARFVPTLVDVLAGEVARRVADPERMRAPARNPRTAVPTRRADSVPCSPRPRDSHAAPARSRRSTPRSDRSASRSC